MTATAVAYKRKLIEMALPLEANLASVHEKSIEYGQPSALHSGGPASLW